METIKRTTFSIEFQMKSEVDLCQMSQTRLRSQLSRYGRRGTNLKEGSGQFSGCH